MFEIHLKFTKETDEFLKKYPIAFRQELIKAFKRSMYFLEGEVKKSFGTVGKPKVKTGTLKRSILSRVEERIGYLIGIVGSDLIYAPVQEFGAIILPKKRPFLRFTIDGRWVTLKKAIIPARPFLFPTMRERLNEMGEMIFKDLSEVANNV